MSTSPTWPSGTHVVFPCCYKMNLSSVAGAPEMLLGRTRVGFQRSLDTEPRHQMDDSHRRFLQAMMRRGIVDEPTAKQLHQHCCSIQNTIYASDQFDEYIDTINSNLEPIFMQIRKGMCEDSGLQHYALVNMIETDVTRMTSDYADHELEIFRKIMDLVVDSDTGRAYSTEILNSTVTLPQKTKKTEIEQLLNRFVHDNWLTEKEGVYYLSTRCIIEMEQYIRNMYQDQIKVCRICRNIAFQTQVCENPTCGVKMHKPCMARFFRGTTEPRCPACKDVWTHEIPDDSQG
ncbi:non-structural maintenance of chromosomes element 1 homolog isoform X2 [Syngnathoides biaculeatus]|uniref:non-structural maintenance of chromosomes element 1 homolog isoform X2 n=1 Tax=Syngnathoides biaculeatus TaxID=300417 RepID=UPI002ADD8555|nr:non-structural maintenance of chromosomes element 1 homolog isoform X2 [Syngnathoides biaculeatus]